MSLLRIGVLLLLALGASALASCPSVGYIFPCRCAIGPLCHCPEAHCSGVRDTATLQDALTHFANRGVVNIKIDFSRFNMSGNFFPRGMQVHKLRIRNSWIGWCPESDPLEPLAECLNQFTIVKSNLPTNWTVFSVLKRLEIMEFRECVGDMPTSFADIPASLRMLRLTWCNARDLAPGAFAHMSSLGRVYIQGSKLERIRRGVFSGSSLTMLSLENNCISAVEDGSFDDVPNLISLDLSGNNIRTLPVDAFQNSPRLFVTLSKNPYSCDCSAKWLMKYVDNWKLPQCSEPPSVRGRYMSELEDHFMSC